jgi:hypothetical protein
MLEAGKTSTFVSSWFSVRVDSINYWVVAAFKRTERHVNSVEQVVEGCT